MVREFVATNSANSKTILVDGNILVVNLEQYSISGNALLRSFSTLENSATPTFIVSDGTLAYIGTSDGRVRVYKMSDATFVRNFATVSRKSVDRIVLNGKYLFYLSDGFVYQLDRDTGLGLRMFGNGAVQTFEIYNERLLLNYLSSIKSIDMARTDVGFILTATGV
jgi:outer membrane protein assembly factor BamB